MALSAQARKAAGPAGAGLVILHRFEWLAAGVRAQ
jgi:hypothetical protein